MVGFDLPDAPDVARRLLLEQRLVVHATGPETIRLLPAAHGLRATRSTRPCAGSARRFTRVPARWPTTAAR